MSTYSTTSEQYRPIPFNPNYAVSNWGNVMRIKPGPGTRVGRILKPRLNPGGYPHVGLCFRGKQTTCHVHRLVAALFIGDCPEGKQINHKNGDKSDNRVENLEYVTPKENKRHAIEVLGKHNRGEKSGSSKLTREQVFEIRRRYRNGETQTAIARAFHVTQATVSLIVNRKNWKHI